MNPVELIRFFPAGAIERSTYLNALRVAETEFFDRPGKTLDYRTEAIKSVCNHQLPFQSTSNSLGELLSKIMKVSCPYCGGETKQAGGGGNGCQMTYYFNCNSCGGQVGLTFGEGDISCKPKDKPQRELSYVLKLKKIATESKPLFRRGRIEINGITTFDYSRKVYVGDFVVVKLDTNGTTMPVEFTCTEHDITGQPTHPGGTF